MDVPVKARVECLDGPGGQSTCIIIDPVTRLITHIVVEDKDAPEAQYLVPLGKIKLSMPHLIQLRCTRHELQKMPHFVRIDHERRSVPYTLYSFGDYMIGPTMIMEDDLVPISHEQVPEGELAVHQGARVEAIDGPLGQVAEFLLDPTTEQINYLVLRKQHLWHYRELMVPSSQIEQIKDDTIYLKGDRHTIERMRP